MLKHLAAGLMLFAMTPMGALADDSSSSSSATSVSGSESAAQSQSDASNNSHFNAGQSVTVESNTNVPDRLQAPPLTLFTPEGRAPCKESWGFGTAVPGVGVSFNVPHTDKTCQMFAAHDAFREHNSLQIEEANFMMLCSNFKPYHQAVADLSMDCAALAKSIGQAK